RGELRWRGGGGGGGGGGDLIISNVVDHERAGVGVPHHHAAFAGKAAEITKTNDLPLRADGSQESNPGGEIIGDIVDLNSTSVGVAQNHVGFGTMIVETGKLPTRTPRPQELVSWSARDLVILDVENSSSPVLGFRIIMSVSPRRLKSPKPMTCHSRPTVPSKAALVMLLLLMS